MSEEIKKEKDILAKEIKELDNEIESESYKLKTIKNIQDEVNKMNDSLNACIAITSSSIENSKVKERCEELREESNSKNDSSNEMLDSSIDNISDKLETLQQDKDDLEERYEDLDKLEEE